MADTNESIERTIANINSKDAEVAQHNANERAQAAKEKRIAATRGIGAYHKNKEDAQDREKFQASVRMLVRQRNVQRQALDKTNIKIADLCADHFYDTE